MKSLRRSSTRGNWPLVLRDIAFTDCHCQLWKCWLKRLSPTPAQSPADKQCSRAPIRSHECMRRCLACDPKISQARDSARTAAARRNASIPCCTVQPAMLRITRCWAARSSESVMTAKSPPINPLDFLSIQFRRTTGILLAAIVSKCRYLRHRELSVQLIHQFHYRIFSRDK
jgi:hypothetical protein